MSFFKSLTLGAVLTLGALSSGLAQASSAVSSACASLEFMAKMLAGQEKKDSQPGKRETSISSMASRTSILAPALPFCLRTRD